MKRTAITILIIVFLTCQFSYAACPSGNLMPTREETQDLTQEEIEEIFIALLRSIDGELVNREPMDWEEFIEKVEERQDIEPLQEYCTYCFWGVTFLLLFIESGLDPLYSILFTFHLIIPSCSMCLISFFP